MPQPFEIDDYASSLFDGLSGFWQRFFRDTQDLHAFYRASEQYLGQVYLDLLGSVLSTGISDTPVFNKEYWKLFLIQERDLNFVLMTPKTVISMICQGQLCLWCSCRIPSLTPL
jgi:hypothetical protein